MALMYAIWMLTSIATLFPHTRCCSQKQMSHWDIQNQICATQQYLISKSPTIGNTFKSANFLHVMTSPLAVDNMRWPYLLLHLFRNLWEAFHWSRINRAEDLHQASKVKTLIVRSCSMSDLMKAQKSLEASKFRILIHHDINRQPFNLSCTFPLFTEEKRWLKIEGLWFLEFEGNNEPVTSSQILQHWVACIILNRK